MRAVHSLPFAIAVARALAQVDAECRCMPTDPCWPSVEEWAQFNASVDGRLIRTSPLAIPCHEPYYNEAECRALQLGWTQPGLHESSSCSIMAAAVANNTCDPFTPSSLPCIFGNMVEYAVNVSSPTDIGQTMAFAHEKNIRLVIRNTGHDFLGKSTGAGALSIWTHHLKDIEFFDYTSPQYSGPAVKMGAGVQGFEIYAAAHARNALVVGGECATVGPVGGYTQGGGHSVLSSKYGLGADQTLEWEVLDGRGQLLRASRTENPDLYWALSGGGGGTYGIVTSLTVKVYPDFPVVGVVLEFEADQDNLDPFYEAVEYYHQLVPGFSAAGGMTIARVMNTSFLLTPLSLPNITVGAATKLVQPMTDKLESLGISYSMNITRSPTYLDHYMTLVEPNPTQHVNNAQYGGKLIPLSVIEENNSGLTAAVRKITQAGAVFVGIGLNVSSAVTGETNNAVLPSWRTSAMDVILSTPWPSGADLSKMRTLADRMTNEWMPALQELTPDPSCYMNEADPQQPNWQEAFYGPNYDRLLEIKQKYDPLGMFYAPTAVGSDQWMVERDGRLCKVNDA